MLLLFLKHFAVSFRLLVRPRHRGCGYATTRQALQTFVEDYLPASYSTPNRTLPCQVDCYAHFVLLDYVKVFRDTFLIRLLCEGFESLIGDLLVSTLWIIVSRLLHFRKNLKKS